jgi:pyruvate kinase
MAFTKLVCTLGPASADRVGELVEAGMDVARINLTHGSRKDHDSLVRSVRAASEAAGRPVGVMTDLSGPKIRLGELAAEEVVLQAGQRFVLRPGADDAGDGDGAGVNHLALGSDLEPDDRVLLADGSVELMVTGTGSEVVTQVVRGGPIRSRAGVNVPSERLSVPAITSKDEHDIGWVLRAGVDMVAQSFVRHGDDVRALAGLLGDPRPLLVAKVETRPAADAAEEILEAADAVMVARGDLGVETRIEEIPVLQKRLVSLANRMAKPAIIATQMLETMTASPQPTRAEASDAAGAVFEGADAILLSAETAVGRYPVEAARTAARILHVAETDGAPFVARPGELESVAAEEVGLARAAAVVADRDRAAAIACYTLSGTTARLLSAARPAAPVLAFSPDPATVGRLTLFRGVRPFLAEEAADLDSMIGMMDRRVREAGAATSGQDVVMVASSPAGRQHANLLKLHRLGADGA